MLLRVHLQTEVEELKEGNVCHEKGASFLTILQRSPQKRKHLTSLSAAWQMPPAHKAPLLSYSAGRGAAGFIRQTIFPLACPSPGAPLFSAPDRRLRRKFPLLDSKTPRELTLPRAFQMVLCICGTKEVSGPPRSLQVHYQLASLHRARERLSTSPLWSSSMSTTPSAAFSLQ